MHLCGCTSALRTRMPHAPADMQRPCSYELKDAGISTPGPEPTLATSHSVVKVSLTDPQSNRQQCRGEDCRWDHCGEFSLEAVEVWEMVAHHPKIKNLGWLNEDAGLLSWCLGLCSEKRTHCFLSSNHLNESSLFLHKKKAKPRSYKGDCEVGLRSL